MNYGHGQQSVTVRLSINPRTAKMRRKVILNKLEIGSEKISHSRKKRLCESIFAYSVNRPSTYLCTPVGAVSLSACVSHRLQTVGKPTHRKNAEKSNLKQIRNRIRKKFTQP